MAEVIKIPGATPPPRQALTRRGQGDQRLGEEHAAALHPMLEQEMIVFIVHEVRLIANYLNSLVTK